MTLCHAQCQFFWAFNDEYGEMHTALSLLVNADQHKDIYHHRVGSALAREVPGSLLEQSRGTQARFASLSIGKTSQ